MRERVVRMIFLEIQIFILSETTAILISKGRKKKKLKENKIKDKMRTKEKTKKGQKKMDDFGDSFFGMKTIKN